MSDETRLTPQQIAAITTRGVSIGLSAGAGCGKTFVLTERFLTYLEPADNDQNAADPFASVVAITFTDRAAREMRDRVRSECKRRLDGCAAGEVAHWLSIFRRIDAARISTIHSFCAGFLRRHAVAAGVDPQFRLMEEDTGDTLTRLSIARTVRRLLEAGDVNCLALVAHFGLAGTRRAIRSLLAGRALVDPVPFLGRPAAEFAAAWLDQRERVFIPRLLRGLAESNLVSGIRDLLSGCEPSNPVMQERRAILLDRLPRLAANPAADPAPLLAEIRGCAQVKGGGSKKAWSNEEIYESVRDAFEELRGEIDDISEFIQLDPRDLEQAAELTAAAVSVVEAAADDFQSAKNAAALLDFDDLLVRTRDLLLGSESVRKEAARSIAALLVDEFQDTDPIQSEIVDALAGGTRKSAKLFVVGDAKQSIYRFRRADPSVFSKTRAAMPKAGRLPLTRNFRSQPEILNFVNAIFEPLLKEAYEKLEPHHAQVSPQPCIEFLFARGEPDAPDRAENRRRREAEWMARRIQQLLDDPTPRIPERTPGAGEGALRRVQAGDIAILFRALSSVSIYEDVFRRQGIQYYLVGGRAFFAQQEVYDIVNLCTFLDGPDDEVSLVGVLRSPFFSLADDTLFALSGGGSLRQALDAPPPGLPESQQERVRRAAQVLGGLLRKKDRVPLAALLTLAIEQTGYDASLLHEFLGSRKVANLRKLIEMARQFDRAGMGTLADFAQRLRDSVSEETVEELAATNPETSDVVRLMTVHQSKGLEFPVVIVADMERPARGAAWEAVYHRDFGPLLPPPTLGAEERRHPALEMHHEVERDEDRQESLRILYVAMTRAADHLILSCGLPADGRLRSAWMQLVAERFDLATGLPKGDACLGTGLGQKTSPAAIPAIRVHRQIPELSTVPPREEQPARLSEFRAIVEAGEPAPLPPWMIEPLAATRSVPPLLSVSAIERADAELSGSHFSPAEAGPANDPVSDLAEVDVRAEHATVLGTAVHTAIERLAGRDSAQIAAVVKGVLRGLSPIDAKRIAADVVAKRVDAFASSDLWPELAAAKRTFREIDFVLSWPPDCPQQAAAALVTGKLDCLLESADGQWKLIDYKTGRVPAGDPAALFDHFSIQLVLYAEAVRSLIGRPPDSIEIVAIGDEVRRIPLKLWKNSRDAVILRIDAAVRRLVSSGALGD